MTPRQKESLLNHLMELDEGIKELANIHWSYSGSFTETQRSLHDLIEICEKIIKRDTNEVEVQRDSARERGETPQSHIRGRND